MSQYWRFAPVPFLAVPALPSVAYGATIIGLGWSSLALGIIFHVAVLTQLAAFPLWLAVTVRRLHDTGRPATWLLIYAVIAPGWAAIITWCVKTLTGPVVRTEASVLGFLIVAVLVSGIWVLVSVAGTVTVVALCAASGTNGPNRYGPDPTTHPD